MITRKSISFKVTNESVPNKSRRRGFFFPSGRRRRTHSADGIFDGWWRCWRPRGRRLLIPADFCRRRCRRRSNGQHSRHGWCTWFLCISFWGACAGVACPPCRLSNDLHFTDDSVAAFWCCCCLFSGFLVTARRRRTQRAQKIRIEKLETARGSNMINTDNDSPARRRPSATVGLFTWQVGVCEWSYWPCHCHTPVFLIGKKNF